MPDPWIVLQWLFVVIVAWILVLMLAGGVIAIRDAIEARRGWVEVEEDEGGEEVATFTVAEWPGGEGGTEWAEYWQRQTRYLSGDTWDGYESDGK